jgi:hypothetical protein
MAIQLESLLSKSRLMHSGITIVKNKNNLITMAFALHSIIICKPLPKFMKIHVWACDV